MNWHQWIGLPHEFGADPREGVGADCVLMAWLILDDAGIPHPSFDAEWLDMARQGLWADLERLWDEATVQLEAPAPYAVTLFRNGPNGLGVGIVVDSGLLLVHHRRGVRWVPFDFMPQLRFYKFR